MMEEESFGDELADLCHRFWAKLPKTGKPSSADGGREWTVFAAIVMTSCSAGEEAKVVAVGTGNKCLGGSQLSAHGDVLNDCHAEVVAKRAFQRFLWEELQQYLKEGREGLRSDGDSLFVPCAPKEEEEEEENGDGPLLPVAVSPRYRFHLYVNQCPCGDASIFPLSPQVAACSSSSSATSSSPSLAHEKQETNQEAAQEPGKEMAKHKEKDKEVEGTKRKRDAMETKETGEEDNNQLAKTNTTKRKNRNNKRQRPEDIQRTGARCVEGELEDPKGEGMEYHVTGVLRTKPGRGDRTKSMSCSDKIARWTAVGLQGALLSFFIKGGVFLDSIIVGELFHEHSLRRAFVERTDGIHNDGRRVVSILSTKHRFEFSKERIQGRAAELGVKDVASSYSLNWWCRRREEQQRAANNDGTIYPPVEVVVGTLGKRLGINRRNWNNPKLRSRLCKAELFALFWSTIRLLQTSSSSSASPSSSLPPSLQSFLDLSESEQTYHAAKAAAINANLIPTKRFLAHKAFANWIVADPSLEAFTLSASSFD